MADWCILRTAGSSTQRLAESLTEAGFDVWTPIGLIIDRDDQRTRKERRGPLMPQYVFARANQLHDLLATLRTPALQYRVWDAELQRMVARGHPHFIIVRSVDHYALVSEHELRHIRNAELRDRPKEALRTFAVGEKVRASDDGHVGLTGTVVWSKGRKAKVEFARNWIVELETWLLTPALDDESPVHVNNTTTEQAPQAKAA